MLATAADPAVELEAAIRRETVQGDLRGAAEAYRRIAVRAGQNREVAARALLRLAIVYRKQGDAQARQTLERLVKDFVDQTQTVAEARAELARLSPLKGKEALAIRQLWKGPQLVIESVTADGSIASFLNTRTANLGVLDLRTGETRMLTDYGNWSRLNGVVGTNRISPDGKWTAFYAGLHDGKGELRIIATNGSPTKVLHSGVRTNRILPTGWTLDSQDVLGNHTYQQSNGTWQEDIVRIAIVNGAMKVVQRNPVTSGGGLRTSVSPDGRWLASSSNNLPLRIVSMDGKGETTLESSNNSDRLIGWSPDAKHLIFASNRSGAPGLWRQSIDSGRAAGVPELIRALPIMPMGVGFDHKGVLYYSEYTSAVDAYTVGIDAAARRLTGEPRRISNSMEGNTTDLMWSPDGSKLAWLTLDRGRMRDLVVRDLAGGTEKKVVMQVGADLRGSPTWLSNGQIMVSMPLVQSYPATGQEPALYRMDPETGGAIRIGYNGYAWSRDGSKVYHVNGPSILEVDTKTGQKREAYRDPVASYVRDVVPSLDGKKLAFVAHQDAPADKPDFYGPTHIKVADLITGEAKALVQVRPAWYRRMMAWTPDGEHLIYATEWYAGKDQPTRLWIVPVAGGVPSQLGKDFSGRVFGLSVSPDGKQLGFDESRSEYQLFALEGLFTR